MSAAGLSSWAVYDRPELRDSVSGAAGGSVREVLLGLDGVHCAACVGRVERLLVPLATHVQVNLAARTLQFRFDPQRTPLSAILGTLDGAGFAPQVLAQDSRLNARRRGAREQLARIGVAALCAMQVMMLAWPFYGADAASIDPALAHLLRWTQWLIATPAVLYAGWPFLAGAARALRSGRVDMDVPIALSLLIAYVASAAHVLAGRGELYFDSATMFVLLLSGARYLEGRTRITAAGHLRRLLGARKLTAVRVAADGDLELPLANVAIGDVLRVAPGEAVPVDGQLLDVAAELDEALLSGESRPVMHRRGERLLAGSLNVGSAALCLRAEALGADTWLAQITRILGTAQNERPAYQRRLDRYAGAFIITILLLAAGTALLWSQLDPSRALSAALAVLVASCPCALSIAAPLALAAGSGRLAASGVLVARPQALTRLAALDTVVFDKTGTLTTANLTVGEVEALAGVERERCLAICAALERGLPHPIARAFRAYDRGLVVESVTSEPGRGVDGVVDGEHYWLGAAEGVPVGRTMPQDDAAATPLLLRTHDQALAYIEVRAPVRDDAAPLMAALREQGIGVQMLSGDSLLAVQALADTLGIEHVHARMLPEQKLDHVRALQREGHVVLAVGDGVNDAPLLAGADVSCAMPQGAALTQARADLLLLGDALGSLASLRGMARAIRRRIAQNVGWALAYNAFVLPLAIGGALSPWLAALGMSLSSLVVVVNALRLPRVARS
jgi:Cu2+-exporting ATPase